jgi:two-component system, cell cycle sensor histidine kinase and response regulator CckA
MSMNQTTAVVPEGVQEEVTVLLVDDEWLVLAAMGEILRGLGYHVLPASSGPEALRASEQHLAPIHLLLTDVLMPGMNGRELAEQVTAARPETKVIYMSGYTEDTLVQHGVRTNQIAFVRKPFSIMALEEKVREVLGTTTPGPRAFAA